MRHQRKWRSLGRTRSHKRAMLRNMAAQVLYRQRIETTTTRAKEVQRVVEKLITLAKRFRSNPNVGTERKARKLLRPLRVWRQQVVEVELGDNSEARKSVITRPVLEDVDLWRMLVEDLADKYKYRDGGYTRILRTRTNPFDKSELAFIELVDRAGEMRKARPARPNPYTLKNPEAFGYDRAELWAQQQHLQSPMIPFDESDDFAHIKPE
ncbi:MAG: hypothetical protein MHM6MM_005767 [Cercozoa sp. M6MM]